MDKQQAEYLAQCLANKYFMINMLFRIWDNKTKKVHLVQEQSQSNEPAFADYYRQQHEKKHKRKRAL